MFYAFYEFFFGKRRKKNAFFRCMSNNSLSCAIHIAGRVLYRLNYTFIIEHLEMVKHRAVGSTVALAGALRENKAQTPEREWVFIVSQSLRMICLPGRQNDAVPMFQVLLLSLNFFFLNDSTR